MGADLLKRGSHNFLLVVVFGGAPPQNVAGGCCCGDASGRRVHSATAAPIQQHNSNKLQLPTRADGCHEISRINHHCTSSDIRSFHHRYAVDIQRSGSKTLQQAVVRVPDELEH